MTATEEKDRLNKKIEKLQFENSLLDCCDEIFFNAAEIIDDAIVYNYDVYGHRNLEKELNKLKDKLKEELKNKCQNLIL